MSVEGFEGIDGIESIEGIYRVLWVFRDVFLENNWITMVKVVNVLFVCLFFLG